MPVYNTDVADVFNRIADYLDIQDDNPYRIRAYREAAHTLSNLGREIAYMVESGEDLTKLEGIGKDLAEKIETIVKTGTHPKLNELEDKYPVGLPELLKIDSLGPKRVKKLYDQLNITNLADLEKAAERGKISALDGLGDKTQTSILEATKNRRERGKRYLLNRVEEVVNSLHDYLQKCSAVQRLEIAGSYRRRKETVGDLDLLVTSNESSAVGDYFTEYEDIEEILARGETKISVRLKNELQVDLRIVEAKSFAAALLYFTGSKAHNVNLRSRALKKGWKINEYGLYNDDNKLAGTDEKSIYQHLGCNYIEPELREDRGELEAAGEGNLPELIKINEIRGDFQCHTTASDGANSLREMAAAARQLGYEYLAITDHSHNLGVAGGLKPDELKRQMDEIDRLNEEFDDFRLLKSNEVDILEDGSLDYEDQILERLDVVPAAVHSRFNLSENRQTERIKRALKNPHVDFLVHPTGRKLNYRGPYRVDLEEVMKTALAENCALEINAQPERLDLNDVHARKAKEMGLKLVISTDAHNAQNLDYIKYGVYQARRAWLESADVLNSRAWNKIKDFF